MTFNRITSVITKLERLIIHFYTTRKSSFACIALLSRDLDLGGIIGGMIPSGLGTHFDVSKQCDTFLDVSKQCDTFRFKANAISLFCVLHYLRFTMAKVNKFNTYPAVSH